MSDWIDIRKDPAHVARERAKARELRQTDWWRQQAQRGVCHYCGQTVPPDQITMDHVVPVIRGGKSSRGNVVPSCKACNNKKKHMLPIEWEEYLTTLPGAGGID